MDIVSGDIFMEGAGMNIREVEKETGIKKTNIRYYENAGLIKAGRNKENNYREYTPDDIELLKKIRFLRTLDISISDIRELETGTLELSEVIGARLAELQRESENLELIRSLCLRLKEENVTFETLRPETAPADAAWLNSVHRIMQMDKSPGPAERNAGTISGYALLFAGMVRDGDPLPAAINFPLLWWGAFFLIGLAITLRNDYWLYQKYRNRFFIVDLAFPALAFLVTAAILCFSGISPAIPFSIPSVPAFPALVYVVMAWIYKQRIVEPGKKVHWFCW